MSALGVELNIGGQTIPIESFDVKGSGAGNTGHMVAGTGMARLAAAGIDLVQLSSAAPTSLPVDVFVDVDGVRSHIFSGEYLSAKFSYTRTLVSIHARDWSGPLVDQRRVLVSILGGNTGPLAPSEVATGGVNTQNQKLSQIVTSIANQFGLTPDLRLAQGGDVDVGTIFGDSANTILTTTPQSLWAILTRLARDSGNIVYTTPGKSLVFGAPGAGLPTLPFTYMVNPIPAGSFGAMSLDVSHNPRRNQTFQVIVLSYDPTSSTLTKGLAYVIGSNFSTNDNAKVNAGLWTGPQAQAILSATTSNSGAAGTQKNNQVPIYTFHVDGLTQAQAQQRAQSIALDISKRELVVDIKSNFIAAVQPSSPASLDGQISQDFIAHQYFVTEYTHKYVLNPKSEKGELDTHLRLLDRQPVGAGESISTASGAG
jgi:hypothetical protein